MGSTGAGSRGCEARVRGSGGAEGASLRKGLIWMCGTEESCSGSLPARATSTSRACCRVSTVLTLETTPSRRLIPFPPRLEDSTADEQNYLPEVYERLYLRLWLPPVLGRRLRALVRETSQLQLLPRQVEISA